MSNADRLIEELMHNVRASGGQPLEQRLADLTVWYYKNKETLDPLNLSARQLFLEKAFWILLEVMALQTERIHKLEDAGKSKSLWTMRGMSVDGPIKRFG